MIHRAAVYVGSSGIPLAAGAANAADRGPAWATVLSVAVAIAGFALTQLWAWRRDCREERESRIREALAASRIRQHRDEFEPDGPAHE